MPTLIKKAALTTLALVLLGLAGGYAFLTSDTFRELARDKAIEWFEGRFRARLSIEQLDWLPFSNSVVVRGVALHDPDSADEQPAISFREAVVNFSLLSLLSPRFELQEVRLQD